MHFNEIDDMMRKEQFVEILKQHEGKAKAQMGLDRQ